MASARAAWSFDVRLTPRERWAMVSAALGVRFMIFIASIVVAAPVIMFAYAYYLHPEQVSEMFDGDWSSAGAVFLLILAFCVPGAFLLSFLIAWLRSLFSRASDRVEVDSAGVRADGRRRLVWLRWAEMKSVNITRTTVNFRGRRGLVTIPLRLIGGGPEQQEFLSFVHARSRTSSARFERFIPRPA